MSVKELWEELEQIIAALASSGFAGIDGETIAKMDKCAASAAELNMKEGKRLIENLSDIMKAIVEGKSNDDSGFLRLTALDFYLKKHLPTESVEDL